MKNLGLVREDGSWRPGPAPAELMAEAVDEAVEFIVSIVEAEAQRGGAQNEALGLELVRVIDDRIDDAEQRMAGRVSGGCCEVASAALRCRRERLAVL